MRGIKSNGMLLAASDEPHEHVELLVPPEGSIPGERVWFGSEDDKEEQLSAANPNQVCNEILDYKFCHITSISLFNLYEINMWDILLTNIGL